jgi:tetratricopeptide (TPR) repeat protein
MHFLSAQSLPFIRLAQAICLLWLFVATPASGKSWRSHSLEFMDTLFWVADDPRTALAWSTAELEKHRPHEDETRYIKIMNLAMSAAVQMERFEWIKEREVVIKGLWGKARSLGLNEYYLNLGQNLATYLAGVGRSEEAIQIYGQSLQDARALHDINQEIFTLVFFGQYYRNIGKKPEALQLMKEGMDLVKNPRLAIHPFFRSVALLTVILTLQGEGHVADGDAIMEKSFAYLEAQNLRSVTSILAYNVATTYTQGQQPNFAKAQLYVLKARDLARAVADTVSESAALMKLASINNMQGRFTEALDHANAAIKLSHGTDPIWEAYALREKADAQLNLGRLNKALQSIDESLALLPANFQERRVDMLKIKSRIEEKMRDFRSALRTHQAYHELATELSKGQEEEFYARVKADMALETEEQKNLILKQEVELQSGRIREARQLMAGAVALMFFLLLVILSLAIAIRKSQQMARSKMKMQRILELIEEGILTIGSDLKVRADYSPYLTRLYPNIGERLHEDALSLLLPEDFMNAEGRSMIRETLQACLGDSILSWDLNSGNLPTEIAFTQPVPRYVQVHWQPLLDTHERIEGFLLSMRDMTSTRRLEEAIASEQRFVHDLEKKMKELLITRFADARSLVETLSQKLQFWRQDSGVSVLSAATKRELHTHKGVARSLGLKELSSSIHDLESALQDMTIQDPVAALQNLSNQVSQYQRLLMEIFGQQDSSAIKASLLDILGSPIAQLKKHLGSADLEWHGVEVLDCVTHWPSEIVQAVEGCLMHALTNSADHGYIIPKKEGREFGPVLFRIEAHEAEDRIKLTLRDRGAGLNLQMLERLAQKVQFIPNTDETLADVVFLDGASTSASVTTTSGRGVGMSAIRATCREFEGDAHIRNNEDGKGSELTLSFSKRRHHDSNVA